MNVLSLLIPLAMLSAPESTRITTTIDSYPCPSPDGSRIAFQSNRTGRWEIFTMPVGGGSFVQLTDREGDNVTPTWSPDGESIAFASTPGGNSDIYLMNADGSDVRRLTTHEGDDSHPHWSADGSRIFFNSPRTSPDMSVSWSEQWHEVFSMRPDGSDLQQHTDNRTVCTFPSVSPDGSKIVYRKVTDSPGLRWDLSLGERNSEVFVADIDGSNEVNLSNSAAFDGWPLWMPDSERVVFASNRAGPTYGAQLFIVNMGGEVRQVTTGPWSHAQPWPSADGTGMFAYQFQESADFEFGGVVKIELGTEYQR